MGNCTKFGTYPCFLNFPNHVIVFREGILMIYPNSKIYFHVDIYNYFLLKHAHWCSCKLGRVQRVGVDCDPHKAQPNVVPTARLVFGCSKLKGAAKKQAIALRASLPWHQAEKFRLLSCLKWLFRAREYLSFKAS